MLSCARSRSPARAAPRSCELADVPRSQRASSSSASRPIGVNFRDVYEREGRGAIYGRAPLPLIVGAEGAGTVRAGRGRVRRGRPGRVGRGGRARYAERVAVPLKEAVKVPDGRLLRAGRRGDPAGHDRALPEPVDLPGAGRRRVRGARGGGRRRAAADADDQGARRDGDRDGVDRGEARRWRSRAGADEAIGYESFSTFVNDRGGAHVIYDAIGATTFEEGMGALRTRGMFVLYGMASGPAPEWDPQRLNPKSLYLTRPGPAGLHGDARGARVAGGRGLRLDRRRLARRAHRRALPAGGRGAGPPGPRGAADDGEVASAAVSMYLRAACALM